MGHRFESGDLVYGYRLHIDTADRVSEGSSEFGHGSAKFLIEAKGRPHCILERRRNKEEYLSIQLYSGKSTSHDSEKSTSHRESFPHRKGKKDKSGFFSPCPVVTHEKLLAKKAHGKVSKHVVDECRKLALSHLMRKRDSSDTAVEKPETELSCLIV